MHSPNQCTAARSHTQSGTQHPEILREALCGHAVTLVAGALRYEPAGEKRHLAPLKLLAHVDAGGVEYARQVVHAAQRPPAVGLAEADAAGELQVRPRIEPGAVHGVLDEPGRDIVDMPPVGSGHPGDGAQARGRVRSDEQLSRQEQKTLSSNHSRQSVFLKQ